MSSPPSRDPDPPAIANDAAGAAPASQLHPSALRPYTPVREAPTLHDAFTRATSGPSIHAKQVQESAIVSAVRRQLEALDEKLCAHVAREITRVQAQGDRLRETAQARLDTKVSGLDRRLAELSGKCKAISEESQAQIRRMDQTDTLVREWQHELDERVRSKLSDVEQSYQKMNTTSAVAKATTDEVLKRHTVRFVRLEELLEERTAHAQELSQNVADLHGRLLQLEDPASKSQPQKGDVDKPIKDVAALVGFEKQSFDVQSKVEQLEQELTGFRSNVTLQQEQYKALCARFEAKDEQIKEQLGYKTFTSQLEEMQGRLRDCEEVRTTQTQQLEALQQRLIVQGEHGVPDVQGTMGAAFRPMALPIWGVCTLCSPTTRFVQLRAQSQLEPTLHTSYQQLQEIAVMEFQEALEAWQVQNLLGAIRLFLKSAQKGHEVGEYCFRWGQYHELPPSDIAKAVRWYRRGARMNHQACTTMLGKIHFALGQHSEARVWLSRTALPQGDGGATGDSLAQWFLAEMELQKGALRDAVRWWKRSAENGDVDAMMRLSQVFSEGAAGIPKERMRARHWLLAAAAHGHQDALGTVNWSIPVRPEVEKRWIDDMERRGWV